jgi:hypothetical protein
MQGQTTGRTTDRRLERGFQHSVPFQEDWLGVDVGGGDDSTMLIVLVQPLAPEDP